MKKVFKFTTLLAMLLCVGFVFTGCGSQLDTDVSVNIGNDADYVACSETNNFVTAMEGFETPETFTQSIKFTLKANLAGQEGKDFTNPDFYVNVILEMTEDSFGVAAKIKMNVEGEQQTAEIYVKENVLYINDGTSKISMSLEDMMGGSGQTPEFDMETMMQPVMDAMQNWETQKVNADGSIYMLDVEGTKLYLVIKENMVHQAYAEMNGFDLGAILEVFDPSMAEGAPTLDVSVGMEFVTNGIDYPSFEGYTDASL